MYPAELAERHRFLISKCKYLRQTTSKMAYKNMYGSESSILQAVAGMKLSGLYRKIKMKEISKNIPGPPSYFTRQRDNIMVPDLQTYMQGYRNIKNTCISSKTMEVAFFVMNRQIWTNEKQDKTIRNRGLESEGNKCGLCNIPENTQHILFSCNRYSVEYWEIFS